MICHECRVACEASVSKRVILRELWNEVFSQLSPRTRLESLANCRVGKRQQGFLIFFFIDDKT